MADGFERMVDEALAFFKELSTRNEKAFYEEHKVRYVEEIKKPAEFLASLIAEDLSREMGRTFGSKLFRIHRDVRFSKDKTPYNTHLHVLWSQPDGGPSWFYGLAADYHMVGMGVMGLQGDRLTRYRAFVDHEGDALKEALDASGVEISDWGPDPLKRVPKPYDQDHPHGDLLRRKAFTVRSDLAKDWRETGLVKAVNDRAGVMRPVFEVLQRMG